jgi:hypothetical protein
MAESSFQAYMSIFAHSLVEGSLHPHPNTRTSCFPRSVTTPWLLRMRRSTSTAHLRSNSDLLIARNGSHLSRSSVRMHLCWNLSLARNRNAKLRRRHAYLRRASSRYRLRLRASGHPSAREAIGTTSRLANIAAAGQSRQLHTCLEHLSRHRSTGTLDRIPRIYTSRCPV